MGLGAASSLQRTPSRVTPHCSTPGVQTSSLGRPRSKLGASILSRSGPRHVWKRLIPPPPHFFFNSTMVGCWTPLLLFPPVELLFRDPAIFTLLRSRPFIVFRSPLGPRRVPGLLPDVPSGLVRGSLWLLLSIARRLHHLLHFRVQRSRFY